MSTMRDCRGTAWLVLAAFLPLAALLTLGYGVILLAGAIGGLISRLQQLVYAKGLPNAYGSSWGCRCIWRRCLGRWPPGRA